MVMSLAPYFPLRQHELKGGGRVGVCPWDGHGHAKLPNGGVTTPPPKHHPGPTFAHLVPQHQVGTNDTDYHTICTPSILLWNTVEVSELIVCKGKQEQLLQGRTHCLCGQ